MDATRKELMAELVEIQNQISAPIDILTITGFMTTDELRKHVEWYRAKVAA